jgi:cytochrome P450
MIGYEVSKPEIDQRYLLVSIRISRCYLYFYLTQIIISLALLYCLIAHHDTTASLLEFIACLLLGVDL